MAPAPYTLHLAYNVRKEKLYPPPPPSIKCPVVNISNEQSSSLLVTY